MKVANREKGLSERKCDCGAKPYYTYEEATASGHDDCVLCESCYVGELESSAIENGSLRERIEDLQKELHDGVEAGWHKLRMERDALKARVDELEEQEYKWRRDHIYKEQEATIQKLRKALMWIINEGDLTAPEEMKRVAKQAVNGEKDDQG